MRSDIIATNAKQSVGTFRGGLTKLIAPPARVTVFNNVIGVEEKRIPPFLSKGRGRILKLQKIRIEKFRGIRTAEIDVKTETALVGQNNCGKSSILRALNSFFNFESEKENFNSYRHAFQKTSTSIIDLEFSEIPDDCQLHRTNAEENSVRIRLKYRRSDIWETLHNNNWITCSVEDREELQRFIRYVYVPVSRTDSALSWSPDGLLKEAVMSWVQGHIRNRDRISPKVSRVTDLIKDRALSGLSKHLRTLTHVKDQFIFELDYSTPPDYSLLIRNITLKVKDGEKSFEILDCGSGIQSLAAIGLYSYLAESIGSIYILGIEEPEQNLHPQAQQSMLNTLKDLPLQVIFTTHSSAIIDTLNHEQVVLCRRAFSKTRSFEITVTQLAPSFWNNRNIDRERYYNFYRRKNSEFFFADFVILTESPIDSELVRYLLEDAKLCFAKYSVSIISLDGVNSLDYAYHLLSDLKISFAVVVDKDFFLPYYHDNLEHSRNPQGFPRYRREYKNNRLIQDMLPDPNKRNELLELFFSNHSKAMTILQDINIFCFRYSMEIDLIGSAIAREILFDRLNINENEQSPQELLINRKKKLKNLEVIIETTRSLPVRSLPNSYKKIRKKIPDLVQSSKI